MVRDFNSIQEACAVTDRSGMHLMCACVYALIFYEGRFKRNASDLLHLYETLLPLFKDDVTFFDVDGNNKPKKINPSAFELIPFWASNESEDRGIYGLRLESGEHKGEASDKGLWMYEGLGTGFIKLFLPLESLTTEPEQFVRRITQAVGKLNFISGHAGFGVNFSSDYSTSSEAGRIYHLSRRYLGLDLFNPLASAAWVKHGLSNINWLTFVGDTMLGRLGGLERLATQFESSSAISVSSLPHGAMIRAGADPVFGDVQQGETLEHYRSVGSALRPLRLPNEALRRGNQIGGRENTRAWLDRFS